MVNPKQPQVLDESDFCAEFTSFLWNFINVKAKYYIRGTKFLLISFRKFCCCWQSFSPPHLIFPAQKFTGCVSFTISIITFPGFFRAQNILLFGNLPHWSNKCFVLIDNSNLQSHENLCSNIELAQHSHSLLLVYLSLIPSLLWDCLHVNLFNFSFVTCFSFVV